MNVKNPGFHTVNRVGALGYVFGALFGVSGDRMIKNGNFHYISPLSRKIRFKMDNKTESTTYGNFHNAVLFWRRKRDSNPREVALKRFSRPPRYDRFAIPPDICYLLDKHLRDSRIHNSIILLLCQTKMELFRRSDRSFLAFSKGYQ